MSDIQKQVNENSKNIAVIQNDIETIKNNHLAHIETDMRDTRDAVKSISNRLWWILAALVSATIVTQLGGML